MRVEVMEMRRQNQNQQVRQNQAWPTTLYLTPDVWSPFAGVHVVDGEELHRLIHELWRAGINAQPMDATPIQLVQVGDNDTAIYGRGVHPLYGGGTFYRVRRYRLPEGAALYEWGPYEQVR